VIDKTITNYQPQITIRDIRYQEIRDS